MDMCTIGTEETVQSDQTCRRSQTAVCCCPGCANYALVELLTMLT